MPLALGCFAVSLPAANFDFAAFDNPALIIAVGAKAAGLIYWSMILDTFGYYLLLAPAAVFLWLWLKSKNHGNILGMASLAAIGPYIYLLLAPIWALWLGIVVARGAGEVA